MSRRQYIRRAMRTPVAVSSSIPTNLASSPDLSEIYMEIVCMKAQKLRLPLATAYHPPFSRQPCMETRRVSPSRSAQTAIHLLDTRHKCFGKFLFTSRRVLFRSSAPPCFEAGCVVGISILSTTIASTLAKVKRADGARDHIDDETGGHYRGPGERRKGVSQSSGMAESGKRPIG